jgi:hypothetical protein
VTVPTAPPHRSQRAELPHWALISGPDSKALLRLAGRVPRVPPELEHPLGSIKLRVLSAYFASFLWQTFFEGKHAARIPGLIPVWRAARALMTPLMSRWPQEDRRRIGGLQMTAPRPPKTGERSASQAI